MYVVGSQKNRLIEMVLLSSNNIEVGSGPQIRVRNEKSFSYFSTKTYVVGTQKNRLNEFF